LLLCATRGCRCDRDYRRCGLRAIAITANYTLIDGTTATTKCSSVEFKRRAVPFSVQARDRRSRDNWPAAFARSPLPRHLPRFGHFLSAPTRPENGWTLIIRGPSPFRLSSLEPDAAKPAKASPHRDGKAGGGKEERGKRRRRGRDEGEKRRAHRPRGRLTGIDRALRYARYECFMQYLSRKQRDNS